MRYGRTTCAAMAAAALDGTQKLYTVDLATGAATLVGPFARGDVADIAVPIDVTP